MNVPMIPAIHNQIGLQKLDTPRTEREDRNGILVLSQLMLNQFLLRKQPPNLMPFPVEQAGDLHAADAADMPDRLQANLFQRQSYRSVACGYRLRQDRWNKRPFMAY
ncbi:hypothetical protein D3C81_1825620 [compost metagenome]